MDNQKKMLKRHGADDWVMEFCENVWYLFPKAHIAQLIRRDAYCRNEPDEKKNK